MYFRFSIIKNVHKVIDRVDENDRRIENESFDLIDLFKKKRCDIDCAKHNNCKFENVVYEQLSNKKRVVSRIDCRDYLNQWSVKNEKNINYSK